jgi:hypothetical protein
MTLSGELYRVVKATLGHMPQRTLAVRAGVYQSHISRLMSTDPKCHRLPPWGTADRLYSFCVAYLASMEKDRPGKAVAYGGDTRW